MTVIYCLIDPLTEDVRYVGRAVDPSKRLREHMTPSKLREPTHKNRWIRSLLSRGYSPYMVIAEELLEDEDPNVVERWWIQYFLREGWPLTNSTAGGEGPLPGFRKGFHPTEATRVRISESLSGRKQPSEVVGRRASSNRGKKRSESFCQAMRGSNSSRSKLTETQRDEIRTAMSAGVSKRSLAEKYQVHVSTIWRQEPSDG